ncbi:M1 family metallopeptidase [Yinghuangia seranimata]|uniref:M1 family metallopeptidase n=1 Tax=Yinghuangia seranimata TaxID=408067 RepID=UPI00248CCEBE|nr:M1 family metallopeptidase [Yinghuangia seranimata]MDI2129593.1 M1 family metallopeptidase [Yinghuangia seranimata]
MTRRQRGAAAIGLACAMAMFAGVPATAHAATAGGSPAGAGDPYFPLAGNQGYDVAHYDLDLDFTPATHVLNGQATISAEAKKDLTRFNLDYSGPAISRITVDGRDATYSQDGQELTVVPAKRLKSGHDFTVKVWYGGVPVTIDDPTLGIYGWIYTDDGAVGLNEPDGARNWYPVNDDIGDKATYTFRITTPNGVNALANGEQQGPPCVNGDRTTVTWNERKPMSSYLSMVAIGKFDVTNGRIGNLANVTAVDPTSDGDGAVLQSTTAEAIAWEQQKFGRYPFDSAGGIVDKSGVEYALETQGRPVYDGMPDTDTIVHENAHQWFGDAVTPKTWRDIWLNEGFATYVEWMWDEEHGGPTAQSVFDKYYAKPAGDKFWKLKTGDPGRDEIFSGSAVYYRGAMTLHQLRTTMGDRDFFTLLRTWTEKYRYRNVETKDLLDLAQSISHKNLKPLFDAWLYTEGKPAIP